jgi:hypothetical protein
MKTATLMKTMWALDWSRNKRIPAAVSRPIPVARTGLRSAQPAAARPVAVASAGVARGPCQLEMHPDKTKIVYCKDGRRKGQYPNTKFDFLGYCFGQKAAKNRERNEVFVGFGPQVSAASLKAMRQRIRGARRHEIERARRITKS